MNILNTIAILLTLSAVFSYLNYRFIKLPTAIGIMLISLVLSLLLLLSGKLGFFDLSHQASALISNIDFHTTLINGMLSFLLFFLQNKVLCFPFYIDYLKYLGKNFVKIYEKKTLFEEDFQFS